MHHVGGGLGVPPPRGAWLKLQDLVEDLDGVIGGHLPRVVEGADPVEVQPPGQRRYPLAATVGGTANWLLKAGRNGAARKASPAGRQEFCSPPQAAFSRP